MKRVIVRGILGLALAAAGLLVFQMALMVPGTGVVEAAAAPNNAPQNCVKIAFKIFDSTPDCIPNDPNDGGAIIWYLREILKFCSRALGVVVLLMLVYGGFQYVTSFADPARVKAAKDHIQNALIALLLFLMAFAILNFLIPGGILK